MKISFVDSNSIKIQLHRDQWKQISSSERMAEAFTQDNVIGLDMYDSDILVGFAMLRKYEDHGWFLWNYAIDKEYQNRHYGQKALQNLIEYMKTAYGAREISTTYLVGNTHAKYIYEKVGFVETDVVDEEDCHEVNMIYKISPDNAMI